jgi:hypothetical protein
MTAVWGVIAAFVMTAALRASGAQSPCGLEVGGGLQEWCSPHACMAHVIWHMWSHVWPLYHTACMLLTAEQPSWHYLALVDAMLVPVLVLQGEQPDYLRRIVWPIIIPAHYV